MKERFPILWRVALFIILPLIGTIAGGYFFLRGDLPESERGVQVRGTSGPILIDRDVSGIPSIRAASDHDAFFATGYLHAQDRLWQLELQRRIAQGRLSEVFGSAMLRRDIFMRTLGLYPAAQAALPALGADTRDALQAYADGVNAWLDTHKHLPVEFTLFGIKPERWRPTDSLAWAKVFALGLSGNSNREIQRSLAAPVLDAAEIKTFFADARLPAVALADKADRTALAGLLEVQHDLEEGARIGGRFVGSNAWVVSGRLTESGAPILANDPHLDLQMPSLWYVISQHGAALHSSGMGIVGLPMVVFGQNGDIAWGGTNLMADTQDLFVEQVSSVDRNAYLADGHWVPFEKRVERIAVKAPFPAALHAPIEPVTVEIRSTRHGPLLSDVISVVKQPVSLRWVALDSGDTSVEAMLRINYAKSWEQFNDALKGYVAPALNFLYADKLGNIGYIGAGHIPMRSRGTGAVPVPGWDESYRWTGYIPFGELPRIFNPPSGYIVSANNDMMPPEYGYFISQDWAPASRAQRIKALIDERVQRRKPMSVEDMQIMQADVVSLPAKKLNDMLLTLVKSQDARHKRALALLANWQGEMSVTSQAAAIFNVWTNHIRRKLFEAKLKPAWDQPEQVQYFDALAGGLSIEDLARVLGDPHNPWCTLDDGGKLPLCRALLDAALDDALAELRRLAGDDMNQWTWGSVHHAVFAHVPFSNIKVLDRVFERQTETGGSPDTINVANAGFRLGDGYRQTLGAGFRQIIQLGGRQVTQLVMNSTGQSGNVFSKHYDDMIEPFRKVEFRSIGEPAWGGGSKSICLMPEDKLLGATTGNDLVRNESSCPESGISKP